MDPQIIKRAQVTDHKSEVISTGLSRSKSGGPLTVSWKHDSWLRIKIGVLDYNDAESDAPHSLASLDAKPESANECSIRCTSVEVVRKDG